MCKRTVVLAYVPVIHRGYLDFFISCKGETKEAFVFGEEIIGMFDWLDRKDLRRISPDQAKNSLAAILGPDLVVGIAGAVELAKWNSLDINIIMPDEDECHNLAKRHLGQCRVTFRNVHLRRDKKGVTDTDKVVPDSVVSASEMAKILLVASEEAKKSSDWWRQVGAVVFNDGEVIVSAHNQAALSAREHLYTGDPRSLFKKGLNIELSLFEHAEAVCIAEAARRGLPLDGSEMLVTTFPCPVCAKMIARTGIRRVYYVEGYGMLDAVETLRNRGVEIAKLV